MNRKKVLLYSSGNMLDEFIKKAISGHDDLELTVVHDVRFEEFIETAKRLQPEFIVLTKTVLADYSGLLNRLFHDAVLNSQIISLDDETNNFCLYTRHKVPIQQSSDLVQFIRSTPV